MPRKLERVAVLLVLVASPLWWSTLPPQLGGRVRMVLTGWLEPLYHGVQGVRLETQNFLLGIVRGPALLEQNRVLHTELEALLAHEETHRQLFEENSRLRSLLDFRAKASWRLIPAEVIGRELGLWSRTILLDKGSGDGARVGQAVITPVGLVGRITEVGPASSRAILLTDPRFRLTATLALARVSGLVMGTASGECLVTYLPLEGEIKPGENVLSTGGRSFSPEGIPLGTIQSVRLDSSELFRTARLKAAVNLSGVEELLIVAWTPSDSG